MKSKYLTSIALIAALCCSCAKKNDTAAVIVEEEELPIVELGVASRQEVPQTKTYTATVEADNTNNISSSMPNRIKTITVDVGDRVHRGQTIATLDGSNIDQLKLTLDNAQREYDRALKLLEI